MHDFEEPQISRRIALVAHDNKKVELLGWAEFNVGQLRHHQLDSGHEKLPGDGHEAARWRT